MHVFKLTEEVEDRRNVVGLGGAQFVIALSDQCFPVVTYELTEIVGDLNIAAIQIDDSPKVPADRRGASPTGVELQA
jgi:hypothetical protein